MILGLLIAGLFTGTASAEKTVKTNAPPATIASKGTYTSHAPIYINGNNNFTTLNGVKNGSGTKTDPYIIEGWEINASSADGTNVKNVSAYFEIKNNYIHDGASNNNSGVSFYNVTFGIIEENNISYNNNGICLWSSSKIEVINNTIFSNNGYGIWLSSSGVNNISYNDIRFNNYDGILLASSTINIVSYNVLLNNHGGIYLISLSTANAFHHNNFINNSIGGKQAYDDSIGAGNIWDSNYWSDWTGPDKNHDGIVDNPYLLDGGARAQDNNPLVNSIPNAGAKVPDPFSAPIIILAVLLLTVIICRRQKIM